ncbi:hypothetical protein DMUE_2498 [Dictyocoela muelleri]|nr:hypothetical protein DMUE_2498 [Dictyocoela muelleri]
MRRSRGRPLVGSRATAIGKNIKSRNINLCAAISKFGIIHYKLSITAYNINSFFVFLTEIMTILTKKNITNAVFIMDNVPFHKSEIIKNLINNSGHRYLYLPAYSSFLNPIENLFSQWKDIVRRANINNEEDLFLKINDAISYLSVNYYGNYYKNMLKFLPRCLNNEEIMDG